MLPLNTQLLPNIDNRLLVPLALVKLFMLEVDGPAAVIGPVDTATLAAGRATTAVLSVVG